MGHKDKGRKGDKGKGKKRDRAKGDASMSKPVAAAEAAPKVAPKASRPSVSTQKVAARSAAARRVPASKAEAPNGDHQPLPTDRPSLLALHQAARRQRDAAPLLSGARAEATFEIERIEVQIARAERAMDPPLV